MSFPVHRVCPSCASTEYHEVHPGRIVAFKWDRVCDSCGTRYAVPTPVWASLLIIAIGIVGALTGLYGLVNAVPMPLELLLLVSFIGVAACVQGVRILFWGA